MKIKDITEARQARHGHKPKTVKPGRGGSTEHPYRGYLANSVDSGKTRAQNRDSIAQDIANFQQKGGKIRNVPERKPRKKYGNPFASKHIGGASEINRGTRGNSSLGGGRNISGGKPVVNASATEPESGSARERNNSSLKSRKGGPMKDRKKAAKRGEVKHKGKVGEGLADLDVHITSYGKVDPDFEKSPDHPILIQSKISGKRQRYRSLPEMRKRFNHMDKASFMKMWNEIKAGKHERFKLLRNDMNEAPVKFKIDDGPGRDPSKEFQRQADREKRHTDLQTDREEHMGQVDWKARPKHKYRPGWKS